MRFPFGDFPVSMIPRSLWLLPVLAASVVLPVPVRAQEPLAADLESMLGTRISSASKYLQDTKEAAASVTVISAEDIARFGYLTLFDALTTVRGFYGSQDRNYSYLGVRGFSRPTDYNNRLLVMLNGHVLNENNFSGSFPGLGLGVDMEQVERIEVIRGPASAVYGGSAMLGVVNVVTKAAEQDQSVRLRAETGSAGYRLGVASFSEVFDDQYELSLSTHWFDSTGEDVYSAAFDDPATNNGVAEGLDWENGYGFLGTLRRRDLTLELSGTSRSKGIPTAPWESTFNDERARTRDGRLSAELRYETRVSDNAELVAAGFYDTNGYEGSYPYEAGDGGLYQDENEGRWFGTRTHVTWDASPTSRLLLGVEANVNQKAHFSARDEESGVLSEYDAPFTILSVFAQNELAISSAVSMTLGARLDDYSDLGTSVSPRAALLVHPTRNTTLKLLYGEAFRAPSRWEAYYEEEDYAKRNPDLSPERIRTTEIVLEQQLTAGILGTVSLYDYHMTDLIDETIDPADDLATYQNLSSVSAQGLEVGLRGNFSNGIGGYASYVIQRARDMKEQAISNSPSRLLRAGIHLPVLSVGTAAVEVLHDQERMTVWDLPCPPFTIANLTLSTNELFSGLRATVSIRNLLDTPYMIPGGWEHAQVGIPQRGRTLRLSASVGL